MTNQTPSADLAGDNAGLAACPGCGGNSTRVIGGPGTAGGPKHWAGCDHCNWRTWGNTEAEAIAAWNRREQVGEPFGYWIEQKGAEPTLLRKPAYIPEPSVLRSVTPLYTRPTQADNVLREAQDLLGAALLSSPVDFRKGSAASKVNSLLTRIEAALATTREPALDLHTLEEAAKVVENYELAGMGIESVEDHFQAQLDDIAAAIRAKGGAQ